MVQHCSTCHEVKEKGHTKVCTGKKCTDYSTCQYVAGHPEVKKAQNEEKKRKREELTEQKQKKKEAEQAIKKAEKEKKQQVNVEKKQRKDDFKKEKSKKYFEVPKKFKTIADAHGDGPDTFMQMAAVAKVELEKRKVLATGTDVKKLNKKVVAPIESIVKAAFGNGTEIRDDSGSDGDDVDDFVDFLKVKRSRRLIKFKSPVKKRPLIVELSDDDDVTPAKKRTRGNEADSSPHESTKYSQQSMEPQPLHNPTIPGPVFNNSNTLVSSTINLSNDSAVNNRLTTMENNMQDINRGMQSLKDLLQQLVQNK